MSDKNQSIADLDASLEAELAKAIASVEGEDKSVEPEVEEPEDKGTDEELEDEVEDVEETEVEEEPEAKTEEPPHDGKKRTPEQKQRDALIRMRQEKQEAKRKLQEVEAQGREYQATLNRLMKEAGYEDYASFKKALDEQLAQKEMKEKGYNKEQFSEVDQLRKQLAEKEALLQAKQKAEQFSQASRFDGLVKDYSKRAGVTSKYVYDQLETLGYDVPTLLAQPNPEILIKGLLSDRLVAEKPKKRVDTDKLTPTPPAETKAIDIDALIKQELADYKARKGNS